MEIVESVVPIKMPPPTSIDIDVALACSKYSQWIHASLGYQILCIDMTYRYDGSHAGN